MKDVSVDRILDFLLKMGFERVKIQDCNHGYLKKKKCMIKIDHNRLYAEYLGKTFCINNLTKEEFASFIYYMTLDYKHRKNLSYLLGWDPIGYFKNANRCENDQAKVKLKKLEVLNGIDSIMKQFEI